jgi:hypothetical protein
VTSTAPNSQKGRYIYYHCAGHKGKCNEPYVREEVIAAKFSELIGRLHFAENVHQWIVAGLHESHADEREEIAGADPDGSGGGGPNSTPRSGWWCTQSDTNRSQLGTPLFSPVLPCYF